MLAVGNKLNNFGLRVRETETGKNFFEIFFHEKLLLFIFRTNTEATGRKAKCLCDRRVWNN